MGAENRSVVARIGVREEIVHKKQYEGFGCVCVRVCVIEPSRILVSVVVTQLCA